MTAASSHEATVREMVTDILAQALSGTRLGDEDNFFGAGGDSFGMVRSIAKFKECGLKIAARDFVADPTPSGIVRCVLRTRADTGSDQD